MRKLIPFLLCIFALQLNANVSTTATKSASKASSRIIEEPIFSHNRGFYSSAFNLSITAPDGDSITYTLDGSDPKTSASAITEKSPANVLIDASSGSGRGGKTPGVIVRAFSSKDMYGESGATTHSYIFISEIKKQDAPGGIWPDPSPGEYSWEAKQQMYYPVSQDVVQSSEYIDLIDDAFMDIPTVSIVTDNDHLFDDNTGIYANPNNDGRDWERPASIEIFNTKENDDIQINAGIRIRGGASRMPYNPKHSFRVFFRSEYGASKLEYPLFGDEGADTFDKIDFRTSQNYSWASDYGNGHQNTMLKDVSFRDIQGKMGQPYTRSQYYHLYINGMYWGVYMTQERSEARYAETYMGGDNDDYDVVKPERDLPNNNGNDLKVVATDGNMTAYTRLYEKTEAGFETTNKYYAVQGMNPDGTRNYNYERLLDVDNLIDYLTIVFYSGSYDAPLGKWFGGSQKGNNYFAIYNRENPDGFKWFVHDFEHTMNNKDDLDMYEGLEEEWIITGVEYDGFQTGVEWFNPIMIHLKLMENPEYRIKFADHVYKHFYNGGLLTPMSFYETWGNRKLQIDKAIIAESARWGRTVSYPPRTRNGEWMTITNYIEQNYIPYRTDFVLEKIKEIGLYPSIEPPIVQKSGETVLSSSITISAGNEIQIINNNPTKGDIFYTTDGTDPRAIGGSVSSSAISGGDNKTLTINGTTILKCRVKYNDIWSALEEVQLAVSYSFDKLKITELSYNPADKASVNGSELEFIELKNTGSETLNITGVEFTDGVKFKFGVKTVAAGDFVVIASNAKEFYNEYGFYPDGEYEGNLNNGGENIEIQNAAGNKFIGFSYNDKSPWPTSADGLGSTLVSSVHNPTDIPGNNEYWKASSALGGSPGADDTESTIAPIVISEIMANTEYPHIDAIELYNPTDGAVDVGNWLLSDKKDNLSKFQIPASTVIPAKGYLAIYKGHYESTNTTLSYDATEFGSAFSISSHGEDVYLTSASADKTPTGYITGISFDESDYNISFGTYTNSVDDLHFVAQKNNTLGSANSTPSVGPIVISEIMYHPDEYNYEYIKLTNITDSTVNLWASDNPNNTWKVSGADFVFPTGISLDSDSSLYIIQSDISAAIFRLKYNIEASAQVFNMKGSLDNSGETLRLRKPSTEYTDDAIIKFNYILVDAVKYNDKLPWPIAADGDGTALARIDNNAYGNDPINWEADKSIAPKLTADYTDNTIGENITITFDDDAIWRSMITGVKINNISIDPASYTISSGSMEFASTFFFHQANYTISVEASGYHGANVIQSIEGFQDAPIVSDDNVFNYINEEINLSFDNNIDWRNNIISIKVDGEILAQKDYTISSGEILISEELFPVAKEYSIHIESYGYRTSRLTQIIKNLEVAPQISADFTDNYIDKSLELTFIDNPEWRNSISAMYVNGISVNPAYLSITSGKIKLPENFFPFVAIYELSFEADYYQPAIVNQPIAYIPDTTIADPDTGTVISANEQLTIEAYPNPSSGIFTITVPESSNDISYQVISYQGAMIETGNADSNEFMIDLSHVSDGMYILILNNRHNTNTIRLIKE